MHSKKNPQLQIAVSVVAIKNATALTLGHDARCHKGPELQYIYIARGGVGGLR